jgi:hypothetical protein
MTGIDPIYNLVNTILDDKEVVIFLGAGASMEGTQDGKRFPGFGELLDNILKDWGFDPIHKEKRWENFLEVIKKWEKEKKLSSRLSRYLDGDPGRAHYSLAAFSIALLGEGNTLLYLTTNYDNLMEKAFTDLGRNPVRRYTTVVIPLRPHITGSEFQEIANNVESFIKAGIPVIMRLFGDLNSQSPIFRQEDMKFEPAVEEKLLEWMRKPMIFIGYSFSDKIIQQLFIAARGTSPVFLVTPSGKKVPAYIKELDRVHLIEKRFSEFITDLFEIFKQRNPSIIEKADKILEFIGFVPIPHPTNEPAETKQSSAPGDSPKIKPKIKKILVLAANPVDTVRLRLDEEVREIQEGLQRSKYRSKFQIQSNPAVRLRDLRRALLDYDPHIVHFTGHGNKEGLIVEDEGGMAKRISSEALSGLFELFSDKIECVILSACLSAPQADAISKHINYVIGMKEEIDDKAAIEFAVGFYDALGAGRSVEDAFKFGRNAILQKFPDLSEHLIPVLKKRQKD